LNIASWVGNYELDAVIEDERVATTLEAMYLADLDRSTEIVLRPRRRRGEIHFGDPKGAGAPPDREHKGTSGAGGSASRAAAGALRLGRTVGAALTEPRVLEPAEARLLALVGMALLGVAAAAAFWPLLIAAPLSVILVWVALALLARAYSLRRMRRARGQPKMRVVRASEAATSATPNAESRLPRN
jgi:cardiolipin synthase